VADWSRLPSAPRRHATRCTDPSTQATGRSWVQGHPPCCAPQQRASTCRDTAGQPCGGRGRDQNRRAVSIGIGVGVKLSEVVMEAKRRQRFYRERQAAGQPGRDVSNQRQTSLKPRTQCHAKCERARRSCATTSAPGAAAAVARAVRGAMRRAEQIKQTA
jgi:hypothetical protein